MRQDWSSVDWKAFFLKNPPRFLEKPKIKGHDLPLLLSESWSPAHGLVWLTVLSPISRGPNEQRAKVLAELHCELLEVLAVPIPRGKHLRGSGGMVLEPPSSTWRLKFSTDIEPLFHYLASEKLGSCAGTLPLLRLVELLQTSWHSGRLLECNPSKFI
ncbi:unnamed protein product [Mesocestoides corti]|uniref:Uncharacterized protein n=1 Tax=Mesocestoides corti TaxID=53468 RepID=A0A0R3UF64_MESCO|nr:unnamed protein product [Mesocestoides corti]